MSKLTLSPEDGGYLSSEPESEYAYDDHVDWPPLVDAPYGTCLECGTALENWGAASHGDGDIFDEWGCPLCEEVRHEEHASYCTCQVCQ